MVASSVTHDLAEAEWAWWTDNLSLGTSAVAVSEPSSAGVPIDPRELRHALGRFATGVCVVTTRTNTGLSAGLTVNSFSAVSLSPPLVAWCLGRKAPSMPTFAQATHFAVHVLAQDQHALALHFSQPAEDKFASVRDAFEPGIADLPVLRDALARFECHKTAMVDGGDHVIFIGRVERFAYADRAPLLFHSGRFQAWAAADRAEA